MDTNFVSALGGGSGIDTTSLVKQLVEVEKAPQQGRLDSKKETLDAQISAYGILKSSLAEFQSMLEPLSDNDTFNARSVSFPETDVITPAALDADAQTGSYQIEVIEVAQAQALAINTAVEDKNASVNVSGALTISLGAWTYDGVDNDNPIAFAENEDQTALTLDITSDDSLQDIADKINGADSDVQASVLLVDGNYQLMISAPSGEDNALRISADDPDLNNMFAFNETLRANVTETQQGNDAELKVNGLTVFRESNEIKDVIQGLEFTINKASPGDKFTFAISADKNTAEDAIRGFVEAYNTFYETAKSLTGISTNAETNETSRGDLATDGSAKTLLNSIRNIISTTVPGVSEFNALTNIGIRTQLDGTLEIVDKEFDAAIADNFDKVASIFAPQTSSTSSYVDVSVGSYATNTVAGTYSGAITTAPSKGSAVGDTAPALPLDTVASPGDYTFSVTVDGVTSGELTLSGSFATADDLRTEMQSLINNDATLKEAKAFVDVVIESGGEFKLASREFGATSKVAIATSGVEFAAASGLSTASVSTNGSDASGTINGDAAFGSGNVLLPKIDTDPYGLNFTVRAGAPAEDFSFTYSKGFAGELSALFDSFLSGSGVIKTREDNINNQLDGIEDDQVSLDRKMDVYTDRLTQQYLAMERIISSFQTTGDSLTGLVDRLPFTATS
ncbi:flagellar filament capping protein FliD [Neptunomonas qingdaonensis]|uniref:Flagellar hook-associated protein 2 n=1 Tax=Neptunomonas qingdaonensis TaxID=1045558 RepID=A0A1I2N6V0_9GAMM|nr:flagellar filament capping protein FliD [Neptunomonas qingdaonensis]SFF97447.1 flagellar hook-associated protein 2 [Neptunomonas qingdaonensis]